MTQQATVTLMCPEDVAATLAHLPRNDQCLIKGFILGLVEKNEQARDGERRDSA